MWITDTLELDRLRGETRDQSPWDSGFGFLPKLLISPTTNLLC